MAEAATRDLMDACVDANRIEVLVADASIFLSEGQSCFTRSGRRGATKFALEQLRKARGDLDSLIVELERRL